VVGYLAPASAGRQAGSSRLGSLCSRRACRSSSCSRHAGQAAPESSECRSRPRVDASRRMAQRVAACPLRQTGAFDRELHGPLEHCGAAGAAPFDDRRMSALRETATARRSPGRREGTSAQGHRAATPSRLRRRHRGRAARRVSAILDARGSTSLAGITSSGPLRPFPSRTINPNDFEATFPP
jgi:hypothetical protein